ncbi:choline transporter-like protein 4 [Uloborus diversus]|uniref:choline transporter-like protein 4 n=1 Tax=Uloborus diversus TaxID=327109 RepID=UPI002409ACEE|nr:choline transporter-like protein 4 [Uloborus diversus]
MGKLVIVSITAVTSYYIFATKQNIYKGIPVLNFYLLPPIFITIGSYLIAKAFFSVYEIAIDTMFLCFLEDCERNDGSEGRPYYMSKALMSIFQGSKRYKEPGTVSYH